MKSKRLYFDVKKCMACRTCELVCCVGHSLTKDLAKAIKEKQIVLPKIKVSANCGKNFPITCRHCKDALCVDACIARALSFDNEKKEVIHDKDKCVGCWMCVMVCPYGAIRPDKAARIPIRCDHCVEIGEPSASPRGEPQCAKSCPTKAIVFREESNE